MAAHDVFDIILEKIDPNDFKQPFKLDITQEINELKEAYSCKTCKNLLANPIALNTCRHLQCETCLNTKHMKCSICKFPYTKADVRQSCLAETVVQCIQNIENISNKFLRNENLIEDVIDNPTFLNEKYEIVIAQTSMKRNPKGETPLHLACKKGNLAKVEGLIKSGVDINVTDWGNWSALHEAVQGNHIGCVELLLKNGVLIDTPGIFYMTPLHEAISAKIYRIADLLLEQGADKTALDYSGHTPFNYISEKEVLDKLESIIPTKKCKPKIYFKKEMIIFSENLDEATIALLKERGVNFTNLQTYIQKNEINVTHLIVSQEILNLNVLLGILKGIFIVNKTWTQTFPLNNHPFKYIPQTYKTAVIKSIQNSLEHKPKLFNGINFHVIDHNDKIKIHQTYFTKKDLILLIETGGGNIIWRCPRPGNVQNQMHQPYHAHDTENLKYCCDYIIFDEDIKHELMYNMKELRHKSSRWLIDCILKFKIVD